MNELTLDERILGSLLGCAIGDALGFPVEFKDIEGGSTLVKGLQGNPALYSDDTQMTLAVARGLLAHSRSTHFCSQDSASFVVDELIKWSNDPETPGRAPGSSCLYGCHQLKNNVPWSL